MKNLEESFLELLAEGAKFDIPETIYLMYIDVFQDAYEVNLPLYLCIM